MKTKTATSVGRKVGWKNRNVTGDANGHVVLPKRRFCTAEWLKHLLSVGCERFSPFGRSLIAYSQVFYVQGFAENPDTDDETGYAKVLGKLRGGNIFISFRAIGGDEYNKFDHGSARNLWEGRGA